MYRQIRSEYSGRLAMVVLDRPERRNAFSAELMREMIACARELESRNDVDAVIVSGAGGWFSAALRHPARAAREAALKRRSK
jgi:enoyl-CoA hydratase/carnithine racemase